jgi:hypothetical protein
VGGSQIELGADIKKGSSKAIDFGGGSVVVEFDVDYLAAGWLRCRLGDVREQGQNEGGVPAKHSTRFCC